MDLKEITIETIGGGALPELFAREITRVLNNIDDPNTDPEKARKVTLDVVFRPSKSRDTATVVVSAKSSLAPPMPIANAVYISREAGKIVAYGRDPNQQDLQWNKVVELEPKEDAT